MNEDVKVKNIKNKIKSTQQYCTKSTTESKMMS